MTTEATGPPHQSSAVALGHRHIDHEPVPQQTGPSDDLVFVTRESRRDRERGVLEAHMTGDLDDFSRWTLEPAGAGTRLIFEEDVVAQKRLLRRLAAIGRLVRSTP